VIRTYLIDPSPDRTRNYNALLRAYKAAQTALIVGNKLKDVYLAAKTELGTAENGEVHASADDAFFPITFRLFIYFFIFSNRFSSPLSLLPPSRSHVCSTFSPR
jgi:hypothetical protein